VEFRRCLAVLVLAVFVLTAAAWSRGAEYDEQYTLFLTAGQPRPAWPDGVFPTSLVRETQRGSAGWASIAADLRRTDVHPPLYFWLVATWRDIAGDGLFAARMLSVGFTLGALAMTGAIARRLGMSPALAMLLTLGCHGFTYTGSIARGFALAQLLTLAGAACLQTARGPGRAFTGGVLLGMATLSNSLAVFAAGACLIIPITRAIGSDPHRHGPDTPVNDDEGACVTSIIRAVDISPLPPRPDGGTTARAFPAALLGFALSIPLDAWFFLAQRGSRDGQFPPFEPLDAVGRLARFSAANVFGGLPLYVPEGMRTAVSIGLAAVCLGLIGLLIRRWHRVPPFLVLAALAPPLGLLALGFVFNNTPIELRYLAFAAPFAAMLLAGLPRPASALVLALQTLAVAGLLLRPETMQPARAIAAALPGDTVVLLPRGNDGVGIVGAFGIEAPPDTRVILVPATGPEDGLAGLGRVSLALMAQDDASRAAIAAAQRVLTGPGWRRIAEHAGLITYERVGRAE